MLLAQDELIAKIHATSTRLVLAIAGGGSGALAALLQKPGASRTLLEATVPYSMGAMVDWLGGPVEQACSESTARAMAMAAFLRAVHYESENLPVAGLAATASLATDRPKRGSHRVHLALQTIEQTAIESLVLVKGERSRAEEEEITTRMVLNFLAEACGLPDRLELGLRAGEAASVCRQMAPPAWRELLLGHTEKVRQGPTPAEATRVLFPGAFNPLHAGHRRMAELAAEIVGAPVEFEMAVVNVDKPPLDYVEIDRRLVQFGESETVWLTRAPTFVEKSAQFPGATFAVGADTIRRIAERRYYGGSVQGRDAAIEEIARHGCRFLVFGRAAGEEFTGLEDIDLPEPLRAISQGVPGEQFRADLSSTEIRRGGR